MAGRKGKEDPPKHLHAKRAEIEAGEAVVMGVYRTCFGFVARDGRLVVTRGGLHTCDCVGRPCKLAHLFADSRVRVL